MASKIDQWIERFESDLTSFDEKTSLKLLCMRIEKVVKRDNKPYNLLITGSVEDVILAQLFDTLSQRLDSSLFQCTWSGCVCVIPETLEKAELCDGIVLVEALGKTKDATMRKQVQILRDDLGKTILGCILVQ